MSLPKKITTYGGPDDPYVRVVDELEVEDDVLTVKRRVLLKKPADFIVLELETKEKLSP